MFKLNTPDALVDLPVSWWTIVSVESLKSTEATFGDDNLEYKKASFSFLIFGSPTAKVVVIVSIPTAPPSLTPVTVATPVRVKNWRSLDTDDTLANVSVVNPSLW